MKPGDLLIPRFPFPHLFLGLVISEHPRFISFHYNIETGYSVLWIAYKLNEEDQNPVSQHGITYLKNNYEVCNHTQVC